jgi:hypothetical protein
MLLVVFAPRNAAAQDSSSADLPPAGYGTLRQDDVALRLQAPNLQIRIVPLDERVIRLLSPDTYESFHRVRESKAADIAEAARQHGIHEPTLFLVTFFGLQDQARFSPEIVTVISENRFFRPVEILPLSPLWSGQTLNQRETATAVYVFEDGIRLLAPFTLSYDGSSTNAWEQHLRTLDRERASAAARAAADRRP